MKDKVMDDLVKQGINIGQFVSFDPEGKQRLSRVRGYSPQHKFASVEEAAAAILRNAAPMGQQYEEGFKIFRSVNIRSFLPDEPDGNPFVYGPSSKHKIHDDPELAASKLKELTKQGYHTILNETINDSDGGFSGVILGNLFEFSSRDIPRCVEKPGCALLSKEMTLELIRRVYRFNFECPSLDHRIEFSIHPGPVGYLGQNQVIWQMEKMSFPEEETIVPRWPNRYSQDMGDKAFGLLIADLLGLPVPFTHVYSRVIPYFSFGTKLHTNSPWVRTCPRTQEPGLFTTYRGWLDPYELMNREDPTGERISAIIFQDGVVGNKKHTVDPEYSGAALTDINGKLVIEGKAGSGDEFMVAKAGPEKLPKRVIRAIEKLWIEASEKLGDDVRFEWVYDGNDPWIVQFHCGRSESSGMNIYPGDPDSWITFNITEGLDQLREIIKRKENNAGIILQGDLGITNHFADLLRKAKIPSKIKR